MLKLKTSLLCIAVLLTQFSSIYSWGNGGHYRIGAIADYFLSPASKTFVRTIDKCSNGKLANCASWADTIKRKMKWSYNLHFIDALFVTPDEATEQNPTQCVIQMDRDCGDKVCIVEAIGNYTTRLMDPTLDPRQKDEALLFFLHFMGDITNPLHNIGKLRGGNDYHAKFDGNSANLHGIWDYVMLDKWTRQNYDNRESLFISKVIEKIEHGEYMNKTQEWIHCPSGEEIIEGIPICPLHWSNIIGTLNCETVWVGIDHDNIDLGGEYYERNAPILETLIAQAGVRIAHILNKIVALNESKRWGGRWTRLTDQLEL